MAPRKYGSLGDSTKSRIYAINDSHVCPGSSLEDDSLLREGAEARRGKRWLTLVIVGCLAVVGMLVITRAGSGRPQTTTTSHAGLVEVGKVATGADVPATVEPRARVSAPPQAPLAFTALNFYQARDGKPAQDYPWLKNVKLIEPHRDTTLSVTAAREGFEYRWQINAVGEEAQGNITASGADCVVVLTNLDENIITLEEINSVGEIARSLQERVMVKYVRREIRTITDDEREELFDSMAQLWLESVDGGDGAKLYGDGYADIYAINRLHFKASGSSKCDHFHDGLGFLTNHALMTNTFESSLQLVNPKLSLPYWDFTIESSSSASTGVDSTEGSSPLSKSPLFDASWFGSHDAEDNMVKDGRWANTKVPKVRNNNPGGIEPDVFSRLRAPWNVNDRAYLSRGMGAMCGVDVEESYPWPTCEMHYELATSFSDFFSWVWYSMYDPHGTVHISIGGVMDCEETIEKMSGLIGESAAKDLAHVSFFYRKNLFRDGFFKCEGSADAHEDTDEVFSEGVCGCLDYDLTEGDDYEIIYKSMFGINRIAGDFDADTKRQVIAAMCSSPVNDGDHLQASSSLDPSFWSMHPTMERVWMFSVLTGKITDYSWPDTETTYTDSDGTTVSESLSLYGANCEGHRGSDVFPFGLLETEANGFDVKTGIRGNPVSGNILSNRDVLDAFDPRANSLSYVYDTFKWDHCSADGIDFDDAWSGRPKPLSVGRPVFEDGVPRGPTYSGIHTLNPRGTPPRNGRG